MLYLTVNILSRPGSLKSIPNSQSCEAIITAYRNASNNQILSLEFSHVWEIIMLLYVSIKALFGFFVILQYIAFNGNSISPTTCWSPWASCKERLGKKFRYYTKTLPIYMYTESFQRSNPWLNSTASTFGEDHWHSPIPTPSLHQAAGRKLLCVPRSLT